jgi:hypothetical protein
MSSGIARGGETMAGTILRARNTLIQALTSTSEKTRIVRNPCHMDRANVAIAFGLLSVSS